MKELKVIKVSLIILTQKEFDKAFKWLSLALKVVVKGFQTTSTNLFPCHDPLTMP